MNNNPAISVLMSVYKEPIEWLKLSLESILKPTFPDFEFIIVIDNPQNKEAKEYINKRANEDKRIVVLTNEENIGLTKSLNKGLKIAKGKYIARMDADDRSYPERFEKQYAYMECHPKVVLCGTSVRDIGNGKGRIRLYPSDNDAVKAEMMFNSGYAHPTIMIRHQVIITHGICYDEAYHQTQDYRLYETLYDLGDFANLPEVLLDYRISDKQISTRLYKRQGSFMQTIRRRMINKWLVRIGFHELDFSHSIDRLALRIAVLNLLNNKKDVYFYSFMKTMYFTNENNKLSVFFNAITNGDFFHLAKRDKFSFIGITLGRVSPIPL